MDKSVTKSAGALNISSDVIVKIVEQTAIETKGVASENKRLATAEPLMSFTKQLYKPTPIKVRLTNEAAVIDIDIIVEQGNKAVSVASSVQESVKSVVQSMTGIAVSKVNVHIAGYKTIKE